MFDKNIITSIASDGIHLEQSLLVGAETVDRLPGPLFYSRTIFVPKHDLEIANVNWLIPLGDRMSSMHLSLKSTKYPFSDYIRIGSPVQGRELLEVLFGYNIDQEVSAAVAKEEAEIEVARLAREAREYEEHKAEQSLISEFFACYPRLRDQITGPVVWKDMINLVKTNDLGRYKESVQSGSYSSWSGETTFYSKLYSFMIGETEVYFRWGSSSVDEYGDD